VLASLAADLAPFTAAANSDATGLAVALLANITYRVRVNLLFQSAAITTGLRLGATFPAMETVSLSANIPAAADGASGALQGWITFSDDAVISIGVQAVSTTYYATLEGIMRPTAAGTFQVRCGTEVAASAITVKARSSVELYIL
jgi:hypothetical protein